jgi:HJR/Mrr/RecB family endonuclease
VQAVVGGCAFYQATSTAVVTTGTFTPAAVELATVTRTILLEHSDLPRLHSMLLARAS